MPPKTLSNGTLALKFMQKAALKAQNGSAPVVELHQAKVVDEAEWDVGKEVRQAWGLAPNGDKRYELLMGGRVGEGTNLNVCFKLI